ncbi:TolC family protein [Limnoglobus roseus]|uniref:TolC family protein n=1 Tax=Limnoglobus roseus TaxID=2598579 RepID=A0A5C1AHF0_9BACT|nr:TolC family protein [Limnoglobus roseus]QEL16388.1 TolC family protein [Limnoglobus roseus]
MPACATLDDQTLPIPIATRVESPKPKPAPAPVREIQQAKFEEPAAAEKGSADTFTITLPAAFALTNANSLDVRIAEERVRLATAGVDRANALWLPNVNLGVDYFRHDGQIQDIVGSVFGTSRSSLMLGAGPQAVVSVTDAVYAPLAARQVLRGSQANAQTVRNDTTFAVAIAYFDVQQARGDVAGSLETLRRADDLVARTAKLAPDLTPDVEVNRAKAEAARRRQAVESAYERWQVASAELTRLLRLQAGTLVEPSEDPSLLVSLIDPDMPLDELLAIGLTHRPELASQQAVIQAALVRVKQEQRRPYYPSLAVRGVGSNVPGLAGGYFGGGVNDDVQNFGARFSVDLQAVWEFQNLGLGNRASVRERESESRRALLEVLRVQDQVKAEIVQAHAQVSRTARRLKSAEEGLANATASAEKNLQGLGQTKRVGELLILVFRPLEAVAAVTALDQAYRDYYQTIADHNRAQFRLYRAMGQPGQALCERAKPAESPAKLP